MAKKKLNFGFILIVLIAGIALGVPLLGIIKSEEGISLGGIGSYLFTAGISLVPLYFFFVKPALLKRRLEKIGLDGIGLIKEVRDTGSTINDNPLVKLILQIQPSDGSPSFESKATTQVSRLNPSIFTPGSHVYVKYDPVKRTTILTTPPESDSGTAPSPGTFNNSMDDVTKALNYLGTTDPDKLKVLLENEDTIDAVIRNTGVSAKAIIMTFEDTGIEINENNRYSIFTVQVIPENGKPFKAQTKGAISHSALSKYQPGKEVWVKYDPKDLTRVALDHS